jgi:hypothetical protein
MPSDGTIEVVNELEIAVIGGVAVAAILALLARASAFFPGFSRAHIQIAPPANELSAAAGARYGLRKIRDGTDQLEEKSRLQNRNHSFRRESGSTDLHTHVRYRTKLGFQFKCYVDLPHGSLTLGEIELLLAGTDLHSPRPDGNSPDGDRATRFWFLLGGYPTCSTADGWTNNNYTYRQ